MAWVNRSVICPSSTALTRRQPKYNPYRSPKPPKNLGEGSAVRIFKGCEDGRLRFIEVSHYSFNLLWRKPQQSPDRKDQHNQHDQFL